MNEITASRTLVKSPPELWAECSDAESLARHLGEFGEIRITRLEPETAVAWEGEEFSGTVRLEPSGWGTKVVITAADANGAPAALAVAHHESEAAAEAGAEPEPGPGPEAGSTPRGLVARLLALLGRAPAPAASPPSVPSPAAPAGLESQPQPAAASEPELHLQSALESLGQAHRRPFSRG